MSTPADANAPLHVVCLCAEWCGVCREWRPVFEALRERHPQAVFGWIDVEDEAEAMGDVDVETFPTLLVARGPRVRFLGPVQPSLAQVSRLLEGLVADAADGRGAGAQADALLDRLHRAALLKS